MGKNPIELTTSIETEKRFLYPGLHGTLILVKNIFTIETTVQPLRSCVNCMLFP